MRKQYEIPWVLYFSLFHILLNWILHCMCYIWLSSSPNKFWFENIFQLDSDGHGKNCYYQQYLLLTKTKD